MLIYAIFYHIQYNSQFSKASTTRENSVKFAAGGPTSENNSIEANLNNGNLYKRRRSTMALLKNTITQSKLNKVNKKRHLIYSI